MRLLICSASTKSHKADTLLYWSLEKIIRYASYDKIDVDYYFQLKNKRPLPLVYNEFLDIAQDGDYTHLVICHDDISIETVNLARYLQDSFKSTGFNLMGVAGTSQVKLESPALWHLMGGGFNSGHLHGAVSHLISDKQKYMTSFGPYPSQVLMIDGVFMAMDDRFKFMCFDEQNPCPWHFYDLDFSLQTHKNGYKVGVTDVNITHASPGLGEFTPEWKEGEEWFLKKHTLPAK